MDSAAALFQEKVKNRIARIPAPVLHHAYAVNCYQHAIGWDDVLIYGMQRGEDPSQDNMLVCTFNYVALIPGGAIIDRNKIPSFAQYRDAILAGCEQDTLKVVGKKPVFKRNHRTLALYFREQDADFHFKHVYPDGTCDDKIMFRGVHRHETVQDDEDSYQLYQYLLCPSDAVDVIRRRIVSGTITEDLDGTRVRFAFLREKPDTLYNGNHVIAYEDLNTVIWANRAMSLPMPTLPRFRHWVGPQLTYLPQIPANDAKSTVAAGLHP